MSNDAICRPRRPGHVIFPELRNITAGMSLCKKMRANMSVASTPKVQAEMTRVYKETYADENLSQGKYHLNLKPKAHCNELSLELAIGLAIGMRRTKGIM